MAEELYQFDFSEEEAKKDNRNFFFLFLPMLIVFVAGLSLYITGFKIKEALPIFCYTSLITFIIFAIEMPLIERRMRKIKVFVNDDGIIKKCGKYEKSIQWDNIAWIKINENNKGETVRIQLRGNDKTILWLFGLNEMNKLASLIRERMLGDILLNTKRSKLDIRTAVVISAVSTMIVAIVIASFGVKAMDIFAILAALGTSLFLSLFRPLSKSDIAPKWLETMLIFIMLGACICLLVTFLFMGFLP